ncbi:unnamed protein product, partial [Closterium sp. Yama58-4]
RRGLYGDERDAAGSEMGVGEVDQGRDTDIQHNPRLRDVGQRRRGHGCEEVSQQSRGRGGVDAAGVAVETSGGRRVGGGGGERERQRDVVRQVRRDMARLEARIPWLGVSPSLPLCKSFSSFVQVLLFLCASPSLPLCKSFSFVVPLPSPCVSLDSLLSLFTC